MLYSHTLHCCISFLIRILPHTIPQHTRMVKLCYMQSGLALYSYQLRLKTALSYVYICATDVGGWIDTAYLKMTLGNGINIPKGWT